MSFDETIIHCSAPSLCGIKPANLFSMNTECFSQGKSKIRDWQKLFSKNGRYIVIMPKSETRLLFFIYDEKLLQEICSKSENLKYLAQKGYDVSRGFDFILSELLRRLTHDCNFPHEIGLFLGYPLNDVIGFETQNASGQIFSGYWKVYSDERTAIKMMDAYKNCRDICMKWLNDGYTVPSAAEKYTLLNGGL